MCKFRKFKSILVAVPIALILALGAFPMAANAATPLPNGLTAKVVAITGETISGTIDAAGYDIGIYIGPGAHDVTVTGATVSGANDQGILVQDASSIVIKDSIISHNAVAPFATGQGPEIKAIVLAGTTNSLVKDNIVEDNGDGGIAVLDDGPNHPFAPNTVTTTPIAGTGNLVTGNIVRRNAFDCGIVISAKNADAGVSNNVVSKNTVIGGWSGSPGASLPFVGGIVLATGIFGPATVTNNIVLRNEVTGGLIPGILLHCFGSGQISGTQLIGNVLSDNGTGEDLPNKIDPPSPTGIAIVAELGLPSPPFPSGTPVVTKTQVLSNIVSNDSYGVWVCNANETHIAHLETTAVTTPVFTCP